MFPRRIWVGLLASLTLGWSAFAQEATAPAASPAQTPTYHIPPRQTYAELPAPHSSVLRQRPWHEDFVPESARTQSYGYRNPGGVGRMAEYYPPGDHFQLEDARTSPHITARIGLGGQPDRNEQLRSQSVGTATYSALQTHIDMYGTPRWGFGMGFGW